MKLTPLSADKLKIERGSTEEQAFDLVWNFIKKHGYQKAVEDMLVSFTENWKDIDFIKICSHDESTEVTSNKHKSNVAPFKYIKIYDPRILDTIDVHPKRKLCFHLGLSGLLVCLLAQDCEKSVETAIVS